ncbi:MAG: hypothetical protein A2W93_09410 [Bacteroidetes bacterium GWF2_43_63]|nr:MAG: hypothetical protein A2W93_09410 [Bacteroidetes bacterium GWF2_43_63]
MEDKIYNILWIDDEHETLTGLKGRAKRNSINLMPFKSLNNGMDELERNYSFYDGILFDAKIFENEDDVKGTEDTYNLFRATERMLQIDKKFEVFVLTGQSEAYEDKTFKKAYTRVYKKGSDEEIDRLFKEIKLSSDKQEDTQIRHCYKRVFEVCTKKYIGEHAGHDILSLLKVNNEADIDNHLNTIRKIIEDLFFAFNKLGLLPDEFVKPFVALNESSKFLTGKGSNETLFIEKGYRHSQETHLPPLIASYLRCILSVTQAGSHRSSIDLYLKTIKTPYLFKSVLFQLLDVLVWFKMHVDSNPKTENWVKVEAVKDICESTVELIPGKVININSKAGFAFFKPDNGSPNAYIPSVLVTEFSLCENQRILTRYTPKGKGLEVIEIQQESVH